MSFYIPPDHLEGADYSMIHDAGNQESYAPDPDAHPLFARADYVSDEVCTNEDGSYIPLSISISSSPHTFAVDTSNRAHSEGERGNASYSITNDRSEAGTTPNFSASIPEDVFEHSEDLSFIGEDETDEEEYDADDEASEPDLTLPYSSLIVDDEFPGIFWLEENRLGVFPLYLSLDFFPRWSNPTTTTTMTFTDVSLLPFGGQHAYLTDHPELLEDPENPLPAQDNEEVQASMRP